jgi:hypothetical protein
MRRIVALLAAVVLVASLSVSSVAAGGPPAQVNRVVGNFDMVDEQGNLVGHVVVNFQEPTTRQLVPGTLDVYWAPGAAQASPPFPFMALDWPPVKESHAQLLGSWFGDEIVPGFGHMISGGASGYLCDYTAPWNAGCRDFSVVFQDFDRRGVQDVIGWAVNPSSPGLYDYTYWYKIGRGAFVVTYAGPTGS